MKKKILWIVLALTFLACLYFLMPKVRHIETEDTIPDTKVHGSNISADIDAERPISENISPHPEPTVVPDTVQPKDWKAMPGAVPLQP